MNKTYILSDYPPDCPFCNRAFTPEIITGHAHGFYDLEVFMYCPHSRCQKSFIAYYSIFDSYSNTPSCDFKNTMIGNIGVKTFSDFVQTNFPSFVLIYNEAFAAEQHKLNEICGVGYRKALEFLIKDYCTLNNLAKKDDIEKAMLGKVIDDYVNDTRVKSVSKRAVWLGNDETHYVRKWQGKSIDDLKSLITLTLHWIDAEVLTKTFEEEMPIKH